jgi:hypothetical protein
MSAAEPILETPAAPTTPAAPAYRFATPPGSAPPAAPAPETIPLPEWSQGLETDDQNWLVSKGLHQKTPADVVKLYRNLETFKGVSADKIMQKPDWEKPDSVAAYRKALGVPETPDGYPALEVPIPTGVLDVKPLAAIASKINLDPVQFKGLVEGAGELLTGVFQAEQQRMALENAAGLQALEKEWGAASAKNNQAVQNAITALGISEEEFAALNDSRLMAVGVKRMLARIGSKLGEHPIPDQGGALEVPTSPWARSELKRLMGDTAFFKRMQSGDKDALDRWNHLNTLASSGD